MEEYCIFKLMTKSMELLHIFIQCHLGNSFSILCLSHLAQDESKCVSCDTLIVTKAYYFELLPICHEVRLMALV